MSTFNPSSYTSKMELGADEAALKAEVRARQKLAEMKEAGNRVVDIGQMHTKFDNNWTSNQIFPSLNMN